VDGRAVFSTVGANVVGAGIAAASDCGAGEGFCQIRLARTITRPASATSVSTFERVRFEAGGDAIRARLARTFLMCLVDGRFYSAPRRSARVPPSIASPTVLIHSPPGETAQMTPDEFRAAGHRIVDWIADYRATVESRPVMAQTKPGEIKAKCIETLRQAGAVVDAKAPSDAGAFKSWLRQISQHVAEAATEGGVLGIGGVPVSEAEKATLTEISSALKLAA